MSSPVLLTDVSQLLAIHAGISCVTYLSTDSPLSWLRKKKSTFIDSILTGFTKCLEFYFGDDNVSLILTFGT